MSWVHDTVKAGAVPSQLAPDHVLRGPRMVGVDKARRVRWDPSVEEEDHDDRPPAKRRRCLEDIVVTGRRPRSPSTSGWNRGRRMEVLELTGHPYFVASQFHPEFTSRPTKPSPLFHGLMLAASAQPLP